MAGPRGLNMPYVVIEDCFVRCAQTRNVAAIGAGDVKAEGLAAARVQVAAQQDVDGTWAVMRHFARGILAWSAGAAAVIAGTTAAGMALVGGPDALGVLMLPIVLGGPAVGVVKISSGAKCDQLLRCMALKSLKGSVVLIEGLRGEWRRTVCTNRTRELRGRLD